MNSFDQTQIQGQNAQYINGVLFAAVAYIDGRSFTFQTIEEYEEVTKGQYYCGGLIDEWEIHICDYSTYEAKEFFSHGVEWHMIKFWEQVACDELDGKEMETQHFAAYHALNEYGFRLPSHDMEKFFSMIENGTCYIGTTTYKEELEQRVEDRTDIPDDIVSFIDYDAWVVNDNCAGVREYRMADGTDIWCDTSAMAQQGALA